MHRSSGLLTGIIWQIASVLNSPEASLIFRWMEIVAWSYLMMMIVIIIIIIIITIIIIICIIKL